MISPRQRLIRLFPLLLTLLLLIVSLWMCLAPLPFTRGPLLHEKQAIAETAERIRKNNAANQASIDELAPFWTMRATAMRQPERTGIVAFRERIESAATKTGLRSRTMSNVRRISITDQVMLLEVSFSADGNTSELVTFLNSLYAEAPRIYWRTLGIKPGSGDTLTLTGTMCTLSFVPADDAERAAQEATL